MGCGCNSGGGIQTGGGSCGSSPVSQPPMSGGGSVYNGPSFAPMGGGRTRRRKHTRRHRRSGTRKTRGHGRKRACICPGGCKRSTCPCCTGKRFCCTKRCRGCKCKC